MGKFKEKKPSKRKHDALLEDIPSCHGESSLTKSKKKHKERDPRAESTMLHAESHQGNVTIKKKKKKKKKKDKPEENASCNTSPKMVDTIEEQGADVLDNSSYLEAPPKKKKKRLKPALVDFRGRDESQETDIVMESEMQSTKESVRKKKKKKKLKAEVAVKSEAVNEELQRSRRKNVTIESDLPLKNHTQTSPNVTGISKEDNVEHLSRVVGVKGKKGTIEENLDADGYLLEELKEFVPNIESKESLNISKMIKYDLPRFKEFKKQGIPINHGKFSTKENETLRKNVEDFMALTAITNPTKLFFTHRFQEEKESLNKLKKLHKFFERISEGIPRSCFYIYARGRRMFDGQNYKGKFSESELHTLRKLHTLHGNNWKMISELTGRSANSLEKRFAQLSVKKGPWRRKEVKRLLRAVKAHLVSQLPCGPNSSAPMRVSKETLYRKLPWQEMAVKVKTRSWKQCREKWMSFLSGKMSSGSISTKKKFLEIKIMIIEAMYEMEVEEAAVVNWDKLANLIGNVPPTFVQKKWHKMKICYVPAWQTKCFADIIDFLYEKVLPDLKRRLFKCKDVNESSVRENQESFLLTDIFQDMSEYNMDDEVTEK